MRSREIIIATLEKLDFALRCDPSLIDDTGLLVLDEGHMIGPSEREIRYETLAQRLLRRADAADRRIVYLSAILPSGDELNDLTAWIRSIVASPTLSQGLNLNAAVLLVPALYRAGEKIKGEEFANVAGRAGRAFVDVEGLIVHVMFDKTDWRKKEWGKLVVSAKARTLKSGLIQIVARPLSACRARASWIATKPGNISPTRDLAHDSRLPTGRCI